MSAALAIWTIYDHPKDYPDAFVARLWLVGGDDLPKATTELFTAATLDELHALLPPNLICLSRLEGDDPVIIETWF